jgi:rSAM/selenodomain-associated transferase 2
MISIVIPTYNEALHIGKLVMYLKRAAHGDNLEIIVSDGGSHDNTMEIAEKAGAKAVLSPTKGRANQMNFGASISNGNILYFIHADTFPPQTFVTDIKNAISTGFGCGRYRTKFDSDKAILKINAFFTRFDWFICYGGDQTFFIEKKIFNTLEGFNSSMKIMEDYEIVTRAKKITSYKIFSKPAIISARKYDNNSWFKVQNANRTIIKMYKNGAAQDEIINRYKQMLNY